MMLYPTNSADRRQQPCTTTIRSRRAHPRHVLDTAALNAYVPNNVGSKSHNELTWNHVVSVFTFFGLLMTALVSLCCWSHFQFIVERRRLPANTEFNSQHRRLAPGNKVEVLTVSKNSNIIKALEAEPVYGEYTETEVVPEWFEKGDVEKYFKPKKGGTDCPSTSDGIKWTPETSCPACNKKNRDDCKKCVKDANGKIVKPTGKLYHKKRSATLDLKGWKEITGGRPHYVKENNGNYIIFFCAIQNKWHMCGPDGIYYRVNGKDELLPEAGWYSQKGKTEGVHAYDNVCSIRVVKEDYLK